MNGTITMTASELFCNGILVGFLLGILGTIIFFAMKREIEKPFSISNSQK